MRVDSLAESKFSETQFIDLERVDDTILSK